MMPPSTPKFQHWLYFYTIKRQYNGEISNLIKVGITKIKSDCERLDAMRTRLRKDPYAHPRGTIGETFKLIGMVKGSRYDEQDIIDELYKYKLNATITHIGNGKTLTEYFLDTQLCRKIILKILSHSCASCYDTSNYRCLVENIKCMLHETFEYVPTY